MRDCLPPAGFFQFLCLPGWGNPSGFLGKPRGSEAFSSPGPTLSASKFRFSGAPGASVFPLPACGNLRAVERDGDVLQVFFQGSPARPGFFPRDVGRAVLRSSVQSGSCFRISRRVFRGFSTGFGAVFPGAGRKSGFSACRGSRFPLVLRQAGVESSGFPQKFSPDCGKVRGVFCPVFPSGFRLWASVWKNMGKSAGFLS